MAKNYIPAPDNIDITLRRLKLDYHELPDNFIQDNPVITALFCALSAVFPEGERQFINSVRYYQDQITDDAMIKRIRAFIGQEAHHGNEHESINAKLIEMGWRVDIIENQTIYLNEKLLRMYSPERQLAQTVAMEHITAVFANFLMNNPSFLGDNVHPDIHKLFLWHAIEETEHKSVAFDVYQHVCGDNKLRKKELRILYPFFLTHMIEATSLLLWKKGEFSKFGAWKKAYQTLFGRKGMLAAIKPDIKAYYADDFHPWQHNNADLANQWISTLAI